MGVHPREAAGTITWKMSIKISWCMKLLT